MTRIYRCALYISLPFVVPKPKGKEAPDEMFLEQLYQKLV